MPPRRDPTTSLTASQFQLQQHSGSGSSSPCSISSMSSCSTNRNTSDQSTPNKSDNACAKTATSFASFKQNCNQNKISSTTTNNSPTNSPNSIPPPAPVIYSTTTKEQVSIHHADSDTGHKPNENFMNSILAQIGVYMYK